MHWDLFVEDLAVVTTYTVPYISMCRSFYRDMVLFNRRTLISHFSSGKFARVRRPSLGYG